MAPLQGARQEHRYQLCRDEDCDKFPCRLYKEGRGDGWQYGYQRGHAEGYAEGFGDGLESCPGPHGG
jgi:hypothetical protein